MINVNKENISERLNNTIESLLSDVYTEYGITTGDISPDEVQIWETAVENLTNLFASLIQQNDQHIDTIDDLEYYEGRQMEINGITYELIIESDLSGKRAEWSPIDGRIGYIIEATPGYEGISIPVSVVDESGLECDSESYYNRVENIEEYVNVVKIIATLIIGKYEKS